RNNTSGSNNIAIGAYAGNANTSGSNNSYLGYNAGNANLTGSDNTFLGYVAGQNNTIGGSNTLVGSQAGKGLNSTGNTLIGYQSGQTLTSGNNNTLIGNGTNVASGTITGSAGFGFGAVPGTSNVMVLGGVLSTNTVNVGIGTALPASRLEVEGDIAGGAMLISSYLLPNATLAVTATTYSLFGPVANNQTILPIYVPTGTSQLRAKIRIKSSSATATVSNIRIAITDGSLFDYSTVASNLTTTWQTSPELIINLTNVTLRGWLTMQVEGQGDGTNGPNLGGWTLYSVK
ncbi:MAG: hypothetical protein K2Q22_15710, partial [Cytophagales bacterium]|nr:hypothetical protein [Cytophagales bacterium]